MADTCLLAVWINGDSDGWVGSTGGRPLFQRTYSEAAIPLSARSGPMRGVPRWLSWVESSSSATASTGRTSRRLRSQAEARISRLSPASNTSKFVSLGDCQVAMYRNSRSCWALHPISVRDGREAGRMHTLRRASGPLPFSIRAPNPAHLSDGPH